MRCRRAHGVSGARSAAKPRTRGGLFGFAVGAPGRYRLALGAGAWIDVVRDGSAASSVAHGHGAACSGVRKMTDFDLTPRRYVVQVIDAEASTLDLMVARLPS